MRKYIFVLVLSLLSIAAVAQNRLVRGVVYDTSRKPLQGAVISAVGCDMTAESKENGTFEILVPISTKTLKVGKNGYSSQVLAIDGAYLMFTLKQSVSSGSQSAVSTSSASQSRLVRGVVFDALNMPVQGATLYADRKTEVAVSGSDGTFEVAVPSYTRSITAHKEGCFDQTLEIDGSYLVFTMNVNKDWERVQAEKAAAREKFVADSLAAIKAADKAAADKAAKEEAARIAAEKAAAEKAAKEEAIRKAAYERTLADSLAAVKRAEKKAAQKASAENYDSKFKNRGLINSVDFSYGYQIAKGDVIFSDRGWREYGDQLPLQLTYSIGYRINYLFAISAGAGVLYDVKNISIKNDTFYQDFYPDFKLKQIDVPVFLKADIYMARGKVQPLLTVSGGLYVLSVSPLVDAGIGCSIRLSRSSALNILASFRTTPWPFFDEDAMTSGYKMAPTPGFKVGFSF